MNSKEDTPETEPDPGIHQRPDMPREILSLRLDVESLDYLVRIKRFVNDIGPENDRGRLWDAALTAFLSTGQSDATEEIRREIGRHVEPTRAVVPLGPTQLGDPRARTLQEAAAGLCAAFKLPKDRVDDLYLAAVRVGLRRMAAGIPGTGLSAEPPARSAAAQALRDQLDAKRKAKEETPGTEPDPGAKGGV